MPSSVAASSGLEPAKASSSSSARRFSSTIREIDAETSRQSNRWSTEFSARPIVIPVNPNGPSGLPGRVSQRLDEITPDQVLRLGNVWTKHEGTKSQREGFHKRSLGATCRRRPPVADAEKVLPFPVTIDELPVAPVHRLTGPVILAGETGLAHATSMNAIAIERLSQV